MEILVGVLLGLLVLGVAALLLDQRRRAAPPGAPATPPPAAPAPSEPGRASPLPPVGVLTPEGFFGVHGEPGAAVAGTPPDAGEEPTRDPEEAWAEPSVDAESEVLASQVEAAEAPPRDVPRLIETLRSGDSVACREAVEEIVRHGPSALPALEAALGDPDPDVRIDVRKAIDRIRDDA